MSPSTDLVLGVDGGGSKTHAAVAGLDGRILAQSVGPGCGHGGLGFTRAAATIRRTVDAAMAEAGARGARVACAGVYVSGLDLPDEVAGLREGLVAADWAARVLLLDNDVFALLRSGTDSPAGAAVVCGTGINAVAVGEGGRVGRMLALGRESGDWGGGHGLAEEILWHAARAEDGRGPDTALRAILLARTGLDSVREISIAVNRGRLRVGSWVDLVPQLLGAAAEGDQVAVELVTAQGVEIATCAASVLAEVGLLEHPVPVVLGGGILASRDPILLEACADELARRGVRGPMVLPDRPPVAGAVDLAREALAAVGRVQPPQGQ
jgi:N-acetylglucosamine kinase-like BadF-type ATPase